MESIASRFVSIRPAIEEIPAISGAVGLTYGVVHEGKLLHAESFSYPGKDAQLTLNTQTMFSTCSMTKGLVSSKLSWDAKIKAVLPGFSLQSVELKEKTTLTDILSMRSGLERYNI